jgi:hypothetical protein
LRLLEDISQYFVDIHPTSTDAHRVVSEPIRFVDQRRQPVLRILDSIHPNNHELFALRLLFPSADAITSKEVSTHNGEVYQTFAETARQLDMVSNCYEEVQICLQVAIELRRPLSNMWLRLAQTSYYGSSREPLEAEFWEHLADEGDNVDSVRHKICLLDHPDISGCCDDQQDDQVPPTSDSDSPFALIITEHTQLPRKLLML